MQDFDVYSCLVNQSGRLIRFVCGLDSRGSDLPYQPRYTSHGIQASAIDPWTQTRALISSPTPASLWDLRFPCCPSLTPSQVPATPAGRPPSSHQLQPIPCSAGPSLCDPGGYWVREVRGGSPYCYPRHLSEVSAPEALRPCRATPTWPSASQGSEKSPPPRSSQQWSVPVTLIWQANCFAFGSHIYPLIHQHSCCNFNVLH